MKNSLTIAGIFLLSVILLDFIGAVGFMIYMDCMCFSLGNTLEIINLQAFLTGLCVCLPFCAIASNLFTIFYTIRHTHNRWVDFITYSILCCITWILIVPNSYVLTDIVNKDTKKNEFVNYITPGYFRETPEGTYYFQEIDENNNANGVLINNGKVSTFTNRNVVDIFPRKNNEDSLHDPLFDKTLTPPGVISISFFAFQKFNEVTRATYHGKSLYVVAFFSFALALCSIYGFMKTTKWRLLNVMMVTAAFLFIVTINLGIHASPVTDKFILFVTKKQWTILTDRNILQILFNGTMFIINFVVGSVMAVKNPYANCEEVE